MFGDVCIVKTESGLMAFDIDNVLYEVTVADGDEKGETTVVNARGPAKVGDLNLEIQNEVLYASGTSFKLAGKTTKRAALRNGDRITVGRTTYSIKDRGTAALWKDQEYDRIVARVGNDLVAARGKNLYRIDARTGERVGEGIDFSAARFVPTNTNDGNVYVLGGDAIVYALFAR